MTNITKKSCGFTVYVEVPETVEEFEKDGGAGSCLKNAIEHVIAHSFLSEVRAVIVSTIEKMTEMKRKSRCEIKGNKTLSVFTETENQFISRCRESGTNIDDGEVALAIQKAIGKLKFNVGSHKKDPKELKELIHYVNKNTHLIQVANEKYPDEVANLEHEELIKFIAIKLKEKRDLAAEEALKTL